RSEGGFIEAVKERLKRVVVGDGLQPENSMGPMANPRRLTAMADFMKDAVSHGAKVSVGGDRMEGPGFFWRPTLLSDVPVTARIMNEEPFGPVIVAASFKTFDEAVENANRLPYGLAAFAFTENGRRANL